MLLDEVKRYLNISYEDKDTDQVLTGAIARGKVIVDDYAGVQQDYESEGLPKQLLFDYCRYVRSHAAEMFEINFRRDLISLRERAERKLYEDPNTD